MTPLIRPHQARKGTPQGRINEEVSHQIRDKKTRTRKNMDTTIT